MGRFGRFAVLASLAVASMGFAPEAHAALQKGSWSTPAAGATVSGSQVPLDFTTQQSAVEFVLPYGSYGATVNGTAATGSFDSTRVPNGMATLGAQECDATGCSTVNEMVNVYNPPAPTLSPATNSLVTAGTSITISGSGAATLTVTENSVTTSSAITLPYVFAVPSFATDDVPLGLNVALTGYKVSGYGSYTVTTPLGDPVISKVSAPSSYFPHVDGYRDRFYVSVTTNRPTSAELFILRGTTVVTNSVTDPYNYAPPGMQLQNSVGAGYGLAPGHYTWHVVVTDIQGNETTTADRPLVADERRIVFKKANAVVLASKMRYVNASGKCSTVRKAGKTLVLTSNSKCKAKAGSAGADAIALCYPTVNLYPAINTKQNPTFDYFLLVIGVKSGNGVLLLLQGGTSKVVAGEPISPGRGGDSYQLTILSRKKSQLQFIVAATAGQTLVISSIQVSYTYPKLV